MNKLREMYRESIREAFEKTKSSFVENNYHSTDAYILSQVLLMHSRFITDRFVDGGGGSWLSDSFSQSITNREITRQIKFFWSNYDSAVLAESVSDGWAENYEKLEKLLKCLTEVDILSCSPNFIGIKTTVTSEDLNNTVNPDFFVASNEYLHAIYEAWMERDS